MPGKEILDKMKDLVFAHSEMDTNLHQEPYKSDFFKLFLEAYKNDYFRATAHPRLTGDAISDYFIDNYLREENEENNRKIKVLRTILNMWDEWYYALNKARFEIEKTGMGLS